MAAVADDPIEVLEREAELDENAAEFLGSLRPSDVALLTEAFRDVKQRQSDALHEAIDKGLKGLPFLLRKPVRVILFPEKHQ